MSARLWRPSFTAGGDVKWCSQFGKSLAITQRAKHKVIILSNNSTNLDTPKRMKTCATQKPVHKCSQQHYSQEPKWGNRLKDRFFQNVLREGSIVQWLKKDEELIHITTWRSLENITLSQSSGLSRSHVWMWELDHKASWVPNNWCFWTVVLEKTLESPFDCKEIQPVHPKVDQSWAVEAETPILWPPDAKSWLTWKDPDARKDWGQEEKGTTEDEIVGWHHWLNGHGFRWTLVVGDGQGGLACCGSWGRKESDTTERLNWTELLCSEHTLAVLYHNSHHVCFGIIFRWFSAH